MKCLISINLALVETWLKRDEEVVVKGYKWFGHNRKHLHRNAVRGSGGVGVLVRGEVLNSYQIEILGAEVEHMLWVKLNPGEEEQGLVLAVCYVPLESSSRGRLAKCPREWWKMVNSLKVIDNLRD